MPINDGNGGNLSDTFGNFGSFSGNPMTGGYAAQGGGFGGFFGGGIGSGGSLLGGSYNGVPSYGQPQPYPGGYVDPVYSQPVYTAPPTVTIPTAPMQDPAALASYFGDIPSAVDAMAGMPPPQVDLTGGVPPMKTTLEPVPQTDMTQPFTEQPAPFTGLPGPVPNQTPPSLMGSNVIDPFKVDNQSIQLPTIKADLPGMPPQNAVAPGKMDFLGGSLMGQPMATPGPQVAQAASAVPPSLLGATPSAMDYLRTTPGPAGMSFNGTANTDPARTHMDDLAALDAYKSPYGPETLSMAGQIGQSNFANAAQDMYNMSGYTSPFDKIAPSMGAPATPGLFDSFLGRLQPGDSWINQSPWNAPPGSQPSWSRLWD